MHTSPSRCNDVTMLFYYTSIFLQDDSEVDPLEAFMEGVSNEIKAENKQTNVVKKVKKIVKVCINLK